MEIIYGPYVYPLSSKHILVGGVVCRFNQIRPCASMSSRDWKTDSESRKVSMTDPPPAFTAYPHARSHTHAHA